LSVRKRKQAVINAVARRDGMTPVHYLWIKQKGGRNIEKAPSNLHPENIFAAVGDANFNCSAGCAATNRMTIGYTEIQRMQQSVMCSVEATVTGNRVTAGIHPFMC